MYSAQYHEPLTILKKKDDVQYTQIKHRNLVCTCVLITVCLREIYRVIHSLHYYSIMLYKQGVSIHCRYLIKPVYFSLVITDQILLNLVSVIS